MPNALLCVLAANNEKPDVAICVHVADEPLDTEILRMQSSDYGESCRCYVAKFNGSLRTVERAYGNRSLIPQYEVIPRKWRPAQSLIGFFRGAEVEASSCFGMCFNESIRRNSRIADRTAETVIFLRNEHGFCFR